MGQRSNPIGLRVGIIRGTDSRWFATDNKVYAEWLMQDKTIRDNILEKFGHAGISRIIINRSNNVVVTIMVAHAGVIIGKKGAIIDALKDELTKMCGAEVRINIKEVKRPDADAQIVADIIAKKMEGQGNFKAFVKGAIQSAMRSGALGIKVIVKGRLNGAAIARFEEFTEGSVPMQTLRAQVNYGRSTSYTTSGTCGVKVWIHTGTTLQYDPFESTDESFGSVTPAPAAHKRSGSGFNGVANGGAGRDNRDGKDGRDDRGSSQGQRRPYDRARSDRKDSEGNEGGVKTDAGNRTFRPRTYDGKNVKKVEEMSPEAIEAAAKAKAEKAAADAAMGLKSDGRKIVLERKPHAKTSAPRVKSTVGVDKK